jgi:DNA-binding transcriptional LysR family regulator
LSESVTLLSAVEGDGDEIAVPSGSANNPGYLADDNMNLLDATLRSLGVAILPGYVVKESHDL